MKSREELITAYKASAYVFSMFIVKAEANEILELTESKEYLELMEAANELVKNGIKIKDK